MTRLHHAEARDRRRIRRMRATFRTARPRLSFRLAGLIIIARMGHHEIREVA